MVARETFGVKIEADLKRKFTELVKEKGLSTCVIIEALMRAWLLGFETPALAKVNSSSTMTVHQHFERVVKRGERRKFREFVPEDNFYNKDATIWEYHDVDSEMLSPNGHAPGCQCSECRH